MYETVTFDYKDKYYYAPVNSVLVSELPNIFFPSILQQKIEKKHEIRSFFFNKKSYSLLLRSTCIDYRNNYNKVEFERYELNTYIEKLSIKLMKSLDLNTGSIDFIVDKNGDLFFLEINPIGQFDWVSQIGGYNLYYKIAIYLKSKINEKKS